MERHISFARKKIESDIQWKLTDKGTIKSTQASFSAAKKDVICSGGNTWLWRNWQCYFDGNVY